MDYVIYFVIFILAAVASYSATVSNEYKKRNEKLLNIIQKYIDNDNNNKT